MSNPLNYIDGLGTNTYTVKSSIPINITSLSGKTIKYNIDFTNNYVYWLFGINDLSYNITTTVDINNLGFVIAGDTNSYDTSYNLTSTYHPFNLVTSSKIIPALPKGARVRHYANVITPHIIYGCDYGSDNNGGAGTINKNGKTHNIPNSWYDGHSEGYDKGLNGILYKYCYKPYTNPNRTNMQLSELYGESKQNLMDIQLQSYIGSIGGISKGNIPVFRSNKDISITKTIEPGVVTWRVPNFVYSDDSTIGYYKTGLTDTESYINNIYNLKYNNNTITSKSADYFNNTSGDGTDMLNNDIMSVKIKGTNNATKFQLTSKSDEYNGTYYFFKPIYNFTKKQSDIIIPDIITPSKNITINNISEPINVDIPFTIDSNALLDDMLFNNSNKKLVFYPSGIYSINKKINHGGNYNINYHNRRFVPIVSGSDTNPHDLIETYSIKCVREPYFDENTEILKYNATPNFALIYYPFTIEPLNIPSNVTKLIIDGGASYVPIINLPSVPVGYQLNIQNDSFKSITTNVVRRYVTTGSGKTEKTTISLSSFTSSRPNIIFNYRNDSSGNYWSMDV